MFFNTIDTLIEHHNFKSANIQVAKDKNGLYAIVNLAPDLTKVTDEAMQVACSTPFVLRDTGEGFDTSAETIMETVYQSIVNVDSLDASNLSDALSKTNADTSAKSSNKNPKADTKKPTPQPTAKAISSFFDDNDEL